MNIKDKQNNLWFSILEIMIWVFIFSLWIISIYMIMVATVNMNLYNKNYIIAINIAREQLELVRNIRDSNYEEIKKYNQINPSNENYDDVIELWTYYKIENDFSDSAPFTISMEPMYGYDASMHEWESNITSSQMQEHELCLDTENRYVYCLTTPWKETKFFKYIYVSQVGDANGVIENAMKIKSKVIWYAKWYHEFEVDTIIADWKRL